MNKESNLSRETTRFNDKLTQLLEDFKDQQKSTNFWKSKAFEYIRDFLLFHERRIHKLENMKENDSCKGSNSLVSSSTSTLSIVVNERGEHPPNESSLTSIESIGNMNDEQIRQCLEFYGEVDSISKRSLLECVGVDTKRLIDTQKYEARVMNSAVKRDGQQLVLLVNDIGVFPQNGELVNGMKKLELSLLKDRDNSVVDQLLDFYGLECDYLDFEEKLSFLLLWLGYQKGSDLANNSVEEVTLKQSMDLFREEIRDLITQETQRLDTRITEENRGVKTDLERKITREIRRVETSLQSRFSVGFRERRVSRR